MPEELLQESIRRDGLRIVTKKMSHTERTRLALLAGVGSGHDTEETDGLAHFNEHMAFKGTQTRTWQQINATLGRYFLDSNAETGKLNTTYWGESVSRHAEKLFALLFDIYLNPTFPANEIESERNVILAEIARDEDNDNYKSWFELWKLLWTENPQRKYGTGTAESVSRISQNDLLKAQEYWHVPSNTYVVGTGKIEHQALVDFTNQAFPLNFKKVNQPIWTTESEDPPITNRSIIERPGRQGAMIRIGCKAPNLNEKMTNAALILNGMLGGSEDSLLYQEIRGELGLSYNIEGHYYTADSRLGHYSSYTAEVLPQHIERVEAQMKKIVCEKELDREHFESQKESFIDRWFVGLEYPGAWEDAIIDRVLKEGRDLSYLKDYCQRRIAEVEDTSFEDVNEVRNQILRPENFVTVIVKPAV